ncbi:MAG: Hpt domain-containing protein, partial [Gammaproteobacteria bacterium]|nr:Hpt domain-containing protein [Gammaproteobacteria bacterium]
EEALRDLRRSFHTLKGSGRLVGASDVGEFAWAFESMLNRALDNTVEAGPAMFDLIQQAVDTLPDLLDMYVAGNRPGQNIFALMEQAEAISQGKNIPVEDLAAETISDGASDETLIMETGGELNIISSDESAVLDGRNAGRTVPDIDETLLGIYRKEVESHLASLHSYIEGWRDNVDRAANFKLVRALHTLTGSSRTTSVITLAELFSATENHVKQLETSNRLLSEDVVRALVGCIDFVEQTLAVLDKPGTILPDNQALLHEIFDLQEALPTQDESVSQESNVSQLQPITKKPQPVRNTQSDYDEELLGIFIEEATEILDESDQTLHQWAKDKQNAENVTVMQRLLHTLKGGARLAGLNEMGDLSHSIESMLEAVVDSQLEMTVRVYDILMASQDALLDMLQQVKAKQDLTPASDIISNVKQLLGNEPVDAPVEEIDVAVTWVEPIVPPVDVADEEHISTEAPDSDKHTPA